MLGSAHGVVVDFAELSDAGRDPTKQINEDAAGYAETPCGHLAVVCDGMGGHSAGREASQTAVRSVIEHARAAARATGAGLVLKQSIEHAGRAVYALGGGAPPELRPGSTCVAMLLHEDGAEIAHAGDSRGYLVRGTDLVRLTRDHSMVQQLVDSGMLSPELAAQHPEANKITRALGMLPETAVEVRPEPLGLLAGDTLLLVTDGLTDLVDDSEILGVVRRRVGAGPAQICQELVALANSRGGHDNITVLVLHVVEAPARTARGGTVIQDALRPSGTLVPGAASGRGSKPTLSETAHGAPPTVLDDGRPRPPSTQPALTQVDGGQRLTEPGLEPALGAGARFHDEAPGGHPPSAHSSPLRTLLLVAGACLLLIALSVAVFLVRRDRARRAAEEDSLPPPPQAVGQLTPTPSATLPTGTAAPSAKDAEPPPDAARAGTDGG